MSVIFAGSSPASWASLTALGVQTAADAGAAAGAGAVTQAGLAPQVGQARVRSLYLQEDRPRRPGLAGLDEDRADRPVARGLELEDRLVALKLAYLLALGHAGPGLYLEVDYGQLVHGRAHGWHGDVDQEGIHRGSV